MVDEIQRSAHVSYDQLAAAQRSVLESIALERPLKDILENIVSLIESRFPQIRCAILVANGRGELRCSAASNLPQAMLDPLQRVDIAAGGVQKAIADGCEDLGGCTSVFQRLEQAGKAHGWKAAWHTLIRKPNGILMGAFAAFCDLERVLQAEEVEGLETISRLVHVTIANDQARGNEYVHSVILESVEDAIFFLQVEGKSRYRFLSVNRAFTTLFAVPTEEIAGKMLQDVLPQARHKEVFAHYERACATRSPQCWEETMAARTGEKHGEITITPIFDTEGRCTHFVGAIHDMTARVIAEKDRSQLHQKLHQAQRMQALGTLAGGIAHDFNNILAAIGGNAQLLLEDLPEGVLARRRVQEIDRATRRAVDLVRQILTFSRSSSPSYRVFDPRTVTEEALTLLRSTLPPNIDVRTNFETKVPGIKADATQFHQVLINLVTNAAHASANAQAPIDVKLDAVMQDQLTGEARSRLRPGRYLRLRVIDRGTGMDAATLKRAFEPFFTTRALGEGTGLGLSVVHGIVESHRGFIEIDSMRGRGTEVRVYFPAVDLAEETASAASSVRGTGEHVMYVDDEESLVELMELALTKRGYRVSGFTNPLAALEAFCGDAAAFSVVITDIAMPQMSGTHLAGKLRAIRADIPIIMTSGYIKAEDRAAAQRIGIDQLIYKSNTIDELAAAVAREIEGIKNRH